LLFIEQLNALAKSLGVLRGALSRWLLPYDHNTRIDEQCSTPHSVVDNMPEVSAFPLSPWPLPPCAPLWPLSVTAL